MTQQIDIPGIPNLLNPEPGFISGGQPGPEQLEAAAQAGVGQVINLRPTWEDAGYDEAAKATELGLSYEVLGISGPQDLSPENARKLDELLAQGNGNTTLVHCASGNRVGALMALRAAWVYNKPKAEALDIGRRWGMTNAEAAVSQLLD